MLKVLLITRGIYPLAIGGIEVHVYYLSKVLSKRLYVSILAEGKNDFKGKLTGVNNASLVVVSVPHIPFFSSLVFILKGLLGYMCNIKKVDVIHAHQALTPAVLAFLISRFHRIPFIVTCHGSEIRVQKNRVIRLIQRIVLNLADHVTTISLEIKKILINSYRVDARRISVVPNGYDEQEIAELVKNTEEESPKIVFVGSLRPFKDPLTLLKGFKKIAEKYPNIKLDIIGDGPLRKYLQKFCLENGLRSAVIFEGSKTHEEALRSIANSMIFILTSREEGLPTALIEAMALGKPVIATAVGAIPEVIRNGENGILIPPKRPDCVANALEKLLIDSELRRRFSKAAAESVKDYSWRKISEKYEEIYHELVRSSKRR